MLSLEPVANAPVYAIILAGGSGTRFWPASRRARPKQLLSIARGSSEPLIAQTVRRIESICPGERTLIATGAHLLDATKEALPWLPPSSFLGEPLARNTAACIGWATSVVARRDPEAHVMVLPSDHHIGDVPAFLDALRRALASAAAGTITTVGLLPERPETGYGYIEAGEEVTPGVRRVMRFVEKPDRARAETYVASGRHFWNSGMFFFPARRMLESIRAHMPELHAGLERIGAAAEIGPEREMEETLAVFSALPSESIDYGVMEKESLLHVVPAQFGWSDLGSWESAWELLPKDERGNAIDGSDAVCIDASGNLVKRLSSGKKIIALVGVSDLCVVDTEDALLVIPRERAQDVRSVTEYLAREGRPEL